MATSTTSEWLVPPAGEHCGMSGAPGRRSAVAADHQGRGAWVRRPVGAGWVRVTCTVCGVPWRERDR